MRQRGRSLYERVGVHAPADFRADVHPDPGGQRPRTRSIGCSTSGDGLTTAMSHDDGSPADEWRLRVYRRGGPVALSDLLPLLGHLGLRGARRATRRRSSIGEEQVHLYDIGVRVPPGTDVDGSRQAELQSTFEALMVGEVEADGFNRLVLVGRADGVPGQRAAGYAKYLRQIGFTFSQGYIEDTLVAAPARRVELLVELFEARFDPGARRRAMRRSSRRGAELAIDARRDPSPRRRSHLPGVPDADRRDRAHQPLPVASRRLSFKLDPTTGP